MFAIIGVVREISSNAVKGNSIPSRPAIATK